MSAELSNQLEDQVNAGDRLVKKLKLCCEKLVENDRGKSVKF